jgi:hypothetical protein
MKRVGGTGIAVGLVVLAVLGFQGLLVAGQESGTRVLKATLIGYEEPPSVSTTGHGTFEANISQDEESFDYELTFADLEGVVTQSHIHIGQTGVNGGIAIWLCGTATNPGPAGTPACPSPGGTVTGTASAAQVIGPAGQGVAPGEFAEALRAMRAGFAYANVHSTRNPGGEIRGQIAGHGPNQNR